MKTKLLSLILLLTLLAGCTTAPTPGPTSTATATFLPTSTPTPQPTLTPTPQPTPAPAAMPVPDEPFPTAITEQLITDERLANQQKDFEILTQNDPAVKTEALRLAERLKAIGGETTTSKNMVDGNRWGVIPSCAGKPCILQKTTDGGGTWAVVPDAGAYGELIANPLFAKENYRLTPLGSPVDLPEDATAEVISQSSWLIHVWRDAQSGKIVAWYDAANSQLLSADGKTLEQETVFTPFIPGVTTWEDCQKNTIPWPLTNPEEFTQVLRTLRALDQVYEYKVDLNWPVIPMLDSPMPTAPGGWMYDEQIIIKANTAPRPSFCGLLENPYNDIASVFSVPAVFDLPDKSRITTTITVVSSSNEQKYLSNTFYGENTERANSLINTYVPMNTIHQFINWDMMTIAYITAEGQLPSGDNPNFQTLLDLYNYNDQNGYQQILRKALRGKATKEEIQKLSQAIFPIWRIYPEDDPARNPPEKNP